MPRQLGPDPYDRPADRDAPLVAVVVEELRLSRFLIIHRRWCPCDWRHHTLARARRPAEVRDLRHLLEVMWPHDAVPGFATRDLARRCALAACSPPLPIHPWHRTLMKEHNTMTLVSVLACPDATGKFIVHDPTCGHAARIRAAKDGTGQHHRVACLPDLVRAMYPAEALEGAGSLAEIMEANYEIRDCTPLPVDEPDEPETFEKKAGAAVLRAYEALKALHATALDTDEQRAHEAARRLEQRFALTPARRTSGNLRMDDVRGHLAASSECAAWIGVQAGAAEELAPDASELEKAKRWVATARAMVRRFEAEVWLDAEEEGGTAMGRAFARAEQQGRRRFVRHVSDALHEVTELMEKRGTW